MKDNYKYLLMWEIPEDKPGTQYNKLFKTINYIRKRIEINYKIVDAYNLFVEPVKDRLIRTELLKEFNPDQILFSLNDGEWTDLNFCLFFE